MPKAPSPLAFDVLEDVGDATIEPVSVLTGEGGEINKLAQEEAFLNELVTVRVHESTNENDPPHFILSVNGTNMPVFRGYETTMKRKYVEVLARMRETKFSQPPRDMMNPEAGNVLIPRTADVYPFEVIKDTQAGREWLRKIRQSA